VIRRFVWSDEDFTRRDKQIMSNWGFETKQLHAGQVPDSATGARAVPIYQTTSFVFNDAEHAKNLFALAEIGNIYTRIMNPTTAVLEARIAALEGAPDTAVGLPGALAVASGQAAEVLAILNVAETGDHIVVSSSLYGGTYNLFNYTFPKMGITATFVDDPDDLDAWAAAVQPNTKAFFGETIGNPKANILDLVGISGVAHANNVPLIVDNTVATPYLIRPLEHGADIVVHSATKFIGGHGTSIGGLIVDGGSFDFGASGKHPMLTEPDPSYHGLPYWGALGPGAYIIKARVQLLRDLGPAAAPLNTFLFTQGLETLSLRMERHFENAQKVAEFLDGHDKVESVSYAGLPDSPWYDRAIELGGGKGFGSIVSFDIVGGLEAGQAFVEGLELHSHVANIGDAKSLVIHPASTTHSQLTEAEQATSGVRAGLVRLSVGLETIDDILADLETAFAAVS
jgi:O-acetylhomoserine (thiol)-lyase